LLSRIVGMVVVTGRKMQNPVT